MSCSEVPSFSVLSVYLLQSAERQKTSPIARQPQYRPSALAKLTSQPTSLAALTLAIRRCVTRKG